MVNVHFGISLPLNAKTTAAIAYLNEVVGNERAGARIQSTETNPCACARNFVFQHLCLAGKVVDAKGSTRPRCAEGIAGNQRRLSIVHGQTVVTAAAVRCRKGIVFNDGIIYIIDNQRGSLIFKRIALDGNRICPIALCFKIKRVAAVEEMVVYELQVFANGCRRGCVCKNNASREIGIAVFHAFKPVSLKGDVIGIGQVDDDAVIIVFERFDVQLFKREQAHIVQFQDVIVFIACRFVLPQHAVCIACLRAESDVVDAVAGKIAEVRLFGIRAGLDFKNHIAFCAARDQGVHCFRNGFKICGIRANGVGSDQGGFNGSTQGIVVGIFVGQAVRVLGDEYDFKFAA